MIVRLTHPQGRAVCRQASPTHTALLEQHRVPYGRKQHDYELPAIGWRTLLDDLEAIAWGPRGGRLANLPPSFYTGLSRIHAAVARRERHPALTHQGVMGVDDELLPVFADQNSYSPYPTDTHTRFVVLVPRHHEVRGHTITEWVAADRDFDRYPLHPRHHLDFVMTQ